MPDNSAKIPGRPTNLLGRVSLFLSDAKPFAWPGRKKRQVQAERLNRAALAAANPDRATASTEAWRLVFEQNQFNPRDLADLSQVCTTFYALAERNSVWAPWAPLADLQPARRASQQRAADAPSAPPGASLGRVPRPQNLEEGLLRRRFLQRQSALLARGHTDLEAARQLFTLRAAYRLGPCQTHQQMHDARERWQRVCAQKNWLQNTAMQGKNYDVCRALMEVPFGYDALRHLPEAMISEPTIFAAAYAKNRSYNLSYSVPAVAYDVDLFFRVSWFDVGAYAIVAPALRARFDITVAAMQRSGWYVDLLPPIFHHDANYAQLLAEVPANSPMWRAPEDAALLRSITCYADLIQLACGRGPQGAQGVLGSLQSNDALLRFVAEKWGDDVLQYLPAGPAVRRVAQLLAQAGGGRAVPAG